MSSVCLRCAVGAVAVAALASSASATIYKVERTSNLGNNAAGVMTRLAAQYNDATGVLHWEVDYSDTLADGFTLAINDGPNPKGHAGELALIYFDASGASPVVSAFAYNGKNSSNSFEDGDGNAAGNQAPDSIFDASEEAAWALSASSQALGGGGQRFSLSIQTAGLQAHSPLYPDAVDPWTGIGFAEKIGWWFHSFSGLQTSYDAEGVLTQWDFDDEGWSDKSGISTVEVPAPGSVALIGVAGLAVARRRR